jgi:D-aminopeptidase
LPEMSPLALIAPIRFQAEFFRPIFADQASLLPGAERVNGTTVAYVAQDMDTINRAWMTMLTLAGSAAGGYG